MTTSINSIMSELPKMEYQDLIKLRSLTDMMLNGNPQVQFSSDDEQVVFEAMRAELASAGVNSHIMFSTITTGKYTKGWGRGVAAVSTFIDDSFKDYAKNRQQRFGLCRIFIQALIEELKYRKLPVSAGMIVLNLHKIQHIFAKAFPFYLESGLAYLIVKSMTRNVDTGSFKKTKESKKSA